MEELHACRWPEGRQPISVAPTWTCPECGDVWRVRHLGSVNPAESHDFGTGEYVTSAEWIRETEHSD